MAFKDGFKEGYKVKASAFIEEQMIQCFAEGHARFTECSESELMEKAEKYLQEQENRPIEVIQISEHTFKIK